MANSFQDMKDKHAAKYPTWQEVRESRLKERKYPFCPLKGETIVERIRRLPYRIRNWYWRKPIHSLTWKRERMQKGWSEYDWWSIDKHFAAMIAEVARKYRDDGHGYPCMPNDKGDGEMPEVSAITNWNNILTEMADGFDGYAKEQLSYDAPQVKRAMELFAEWFPALWD